MFKRLSIILVSGILPWAVTLVLLARFTAHYEVILHDFRTVVVNSYYLGCVESSAHPPTYAECKEKAQNFWKEELIGY